MQEGIEAAGVAAQLLTEETIRHLLSVIQHRYVDAGDEDRNLWERFRCDTSRRRADWSLICDYASQRPILLCNEGDRFLGFQFDSGADLRAVLNNCPGFEFYVVDEGVSFVLCHNHHDYLVGVGACKSWLSMLRDDGEPRGAKETSRRIS
jgi:hypothetical protein